MKKVIFSLILAGSFSFSSAAHAGKVAQPPERPQTWEFKLAAPVWLAGTEGESGLHGRSKEFELGAADILQRVDMTAALRLEASKGRFGVMGDFLYLSLSDGIGLKDRVAEKVDLQLDQIVGDLALRWRLVEGARGWVDLTGGMRYTNLYQKSVFQPNNERIEQVAGRLAAAGTGIRALVLKELLALSGYTPQLPNAPLTAEQAEKLAKAAAAVKGNTAERKQALAKILRKAADSTASRTDDWLDPYVGVRAQYNLSSEWYLLAKGDIGGFGLGSELTWQTSGALGWRFARNAYAELGYRALGVDYEDDGFSYDVITRGAELTLGVSF